MKSELGDKARIGHMLEAIIYIQEFTDGVTYEQYLADIKLRLALTRLVEIIGEASNHVSENTKSLFTTVEWDRLRGVRNIIVHEYFGIDYETIWSAIKKDVPSLRRKLDNVLEELDKGAGEPSTI